jgi:hypothetical protein
LIRAGMEALLAAIAATLGNPRASTGEQAPHH